MAQVVVGKRESNGEGRNIYVLREDHLHILLTHERVLVTRRMYSKHDIDTELASRRSGPPTDDSLTLF